MFFPFLGLAMLELQGSEAIRVGMNSRPNKHKRSLTAETSRVCPGMA